MTNAITIIENTSGEVETADLFELAAVLAELDKLTEAEPLANS